MKFGGVIPALLTPYDSSNRVSEDVVRHLVAQYVQLGVDGLYLCGAAGEGILLSVEERKRLVEVVVNEGRKRLRIIVHVGAVRTDDATELGAHAEEAGVDAIASVPPFFYTGGTEAIYQHYSAIAKRCRLPLLLYNIPSLTGVTVTPQMMARFIDIPTVVGMKFSSNDLYQMRQIYELRKEGLNILSGNDEIFLPALVMGADGGIGLTLNFMPKLFMEIFTCFKSGQIDKAQKAQFLANRIIGVLTQFSIIPAAKEIMRLKGFDCGLARGPIEQLTNEQKERLNAALRAIGFFELDLGV